MSTKGPKKGKGGGKERVVHVQPKDNSREREQKVREEHVGGRSAEELYAAQFPERRDKLMEIKRRRESQEREQAILQDLDREQLFQIGKFLDFWNKTFEERRDVGHLFRKSFFEFFNDKNNKRKYDLANASVEQDPTLQRLFSKIRSNDKEAIQCLKAIKKLVSAESAMPVKIPVLISEVLKSPLDASTMRAHEISRRREVLDERDRKVVAEANKRIAKDSSRPKEIRMRQAGGRAAEQLMAEDEREEADRAEAERQKKEKQEQDEHERVVRERLARIQGAARPGRNEERERREGSRQGQPGLASPTQTSRTTGRTPDPDSDRPSADYPSSPMGSRPNSSDGHHKTPEGHPKKRGSKQ